MRPFISASNVACSDSVSPPPSGTAPSIAQPSRSLVTLTGSVQLTDNNSYPVVLNTNDGQRVRLTGESASILVSVDSAGVEVHGQWESDGGNGFFVADFVVESMAGSAVIDGTLIVLSSTADGDPIEYAIRPTLGGRAVKLSGLSPELLTHVNDRLWVAGVDGSGGVPTAYGVIKEM